MSANPHNANLGLPDNALPNEASPNRDLPENALPGNESPDREPINDGTARTRIAIAPVASAPVDHVPGHEALQALLAFSSLHEQLRQRRALEKHGVPLNADVWQLEQF